MSFALALCAMTPDESPPPDKRTEGEDPLLIRVFPGLVRYCGLGVSLWLMVSGRVDPSVALAFAGTMISGSLLAQVWVGRNK